jgi:hypothetical protein
MILLGIKPISQNDFKIVALSDNFILIDHFILHNLYYSYLELENWLNKIKFDTFETLKWFFDDLDIMERKIPCNLFQKIQGHNLAFSVNHRKLMEFIQFFYDYSIFASNSASPICPVFFLASAQRFISESFILKLNLDLEPPV